MPKINEKHTKMYYSKVDYCHELFLQNPLWLLKVRNSELVETLKDKLQLNDRQCRNIIADARNLFNKRQLTKLSDDSKVKQLINELEYIKLQAGKEQKWHIAIQAIREQSILLGLQNIGISIFNNLDLTQLSDAELEKIAYNNQR